MRIEEMLNLEQTPNESTNKLEPFPDEVVSYITEDESGKGVIVCKSGNQYHCRKYTAEECMRLMGVGREDYLRVASSQTENSVYHLAGDSIVVPCL